MTATTLLIAYGAGSICGMQAGITHLSVPPQTSLTDKVHKFALGIFALGLGLTCLGAAIAADVIALKIQVPLLILGGVLYLALHLYYFSSGTGNMKAE